MARVKKFDFEVSLGNGLGTVRAAVVFNVNAAGQFYCRVPEEALKYFSVGAKYSDDVSCNANRSGVKTIYAPTLAALEHAIVEAIRACNAPSITVEHVIQYNIESHAVFAEAADGSVHPNATGNAEWHSRDSVQRSMYGDHGNHHKASGGFSLTVGAQAMTKTTYKTGQRTSVEYSRYHKSGSSNDINEPSTLLNSWLGFKLPAKAKEIPYTDEAALFFHGLMQGMAELSKKIQEATFNQEDLISLTNSQGSLLLGSHNTGADDDTKSLK